MKKLIPLLVLPLLICLSDQLNAQIYTDEVQVIEGLGGKVGVRMVPQTANFEVLLTGSETAGRKLLANGTGLRLQRFGDSGGVTMRYGFLSHDGLTDFGGFGGYLGVSGLNYYFVGSDYQTPIVTFRPNGKVGIGLSQPETRLHLEGQDAVLKGRSSSAAIKLHNTEYAESVTGYGFIEHDAYGDVLLGATRSDDPLNLGFLRLYAGGTEKITVRGNGNVGIGVNVPLGKLHVKTSANTELYTETNDHPMVILKGSVTAGTSSGRVGFYDQTAFVSDNLYYTTNPNKWTGDNVSSPGAMWLLQGGTIVSYSRAAGTEVLEERFRITNDGKIGIGTTTPSRDIEIVAKPNASAEIKLRQPSEQSAWGVSLGQTTTLAGYLYVPGRDLTIEWGWNNILTLGSAQMNNYSGAKILIPGGNVGIGMDPTQKLSVNGNASKSSAGDWVANSDARLKKKIIQLSSSETLDKLLQLKGVTYEWDDYKTGINRPIGIQYGFTAQNIQEVFPELVEEDNLGYLQTAYGTYDAMMIEAMRALNEKIGRLEAENETLRATAIELKKSDEEQHASIAFLQKQMQELAALLISSPLIEPALPKPSQE